MKIRFSIIGFVAMLMLTPLTVLAEQPTLKSAKSDACELLKLDDLTALLGGTPIAKPGRDSCSWTTSGGPNKLSATKYPNTGMAAEMAFSGARKNAAKGGAVINVSGLGDNAFARLDSFGVVLMVINQGKLLQLLYWPGAAGTDKELDALRPVAKKAIAAF